MLLILGCKRTIHNCILRRISQATVVQNLVDFVAVAIFPVLISVPHTMLLYLFSSSAFLKLSYHLSQLFHSSAPKSAAQQESNRQARSPPTEAGDKYMRPGQVSVKTVPTQTKASSKVNVNVLIDQAIVAYGHQKKGLLFLVSMSAQACLVGNESKVHTANAAAAHMALKQAATVCPEHPRLAFAMAQVQRDLRQWEEALRMYRKSLELEQTDNYAHCAR